jgi:hypothetical protein
MVFNQFVSARATGQANSLTYISEWTNSISCGDLQSDKLIYNEQLCTCAGVRAVRLCPISHLVAGA